MPLQTADYYLQCDLIFLDLHYINISERKPMTNQNKGQSIVTGNIGSGGDAIQITLYI